MYFGLKRKLCCSKMKQVASFKEKNDEEKMLEVEIKGMCSTSMWRMALRVVQVNPSGGSIRKAALTEGKRRIRKVFMTVSNQQNELIKSNEEN